MADDTDELPGSPGTDPTSVGWPLVERRSSSRTPPGGVDGRARHQPPPTVSPTLNAAPLWPFRLAALAGAVVRAQPSLSWHNWSLVAITAAAAVFTAVACRRPVAYRNDAKVRLRIVIELAGVTAAILLDRKSVV